MSPTRNSSDNNVLKSMQRGQSIAKDTKSTPLTSLRQIQIRLPQRCKVVPTYTCAPSEEITGATYPLFI